jgi:putative membrane protein
VIGVLQAGGMDRRLLWFVTLLLPIVAWSAVRPHDYFTWMLEVAPIFVGLPIAFAVQRRFPLSNLLLVLLWVHSVILIVGGHYTYARVPLGDWAMEWFGWTRNNYDKIGHFAQGFVPAILAREILLRTSPLRQAQGRPLGRQDDGQKADGSFASAQDNGLAPAARPSRWLGFLVVSVCLAFSAFYELIEWWVAVASGAGADDFLGTQGYAWDTQSDMAWALGGAILALVVCSRGHDRSLARLRQRSDPGAG